MLEWRQEGQPTPLDHLRLQPPGGQYLPPPHWAQPPVFTMRLPPSFTLSPPTQTPGL